MNSLQLQMATDESVDLMLESLSRDVRDMSLGHFFEEARNLECATRTFEFKEQNNNQTVTDSEAFESAKEEESKDIEQAVDAQIQESSSESNHEPVIETAEVGIQAFGSKIKPKFVDQWTETDPEPELEEPKQLGIEIACQYSEQVMMAEDV